jgi:hypothetical protein
MTKMQIKTESLPERCEICHQIDLFDAQRNYCSRCADVPTLINESSISRIVKAPTVTDIELGAFVGLVTGLLIGIVGGAIAFSVQGSVMGAIVGAMSLGPVWMIQGAIIGLIVGRSARLTDAADIRAVSMAISATSPGNRNSQKFNKLFIVLKASLIGLIITMPSWMIFEDNILDSYKTVVWAICGIVNGIIINSLCRNRSDRRENSSYTE